MSVTPFIPDPSGLPRVRAPYRSMWLGPFGAVTGWAISGLVVAAWIWWRAPLIDDTRPELPHTD